MDGLAALVAAEGSGADAHAFALTSRDAGVRDLSDAVHLLCTLHGRHPGVVDHALARTVNAPAWLIEAAEGFARERSYLAQLAAAAGPMPSTPGQAECEATVAGQRHALETLARSERDGCTLGAVAAAVLDWRALRPVLDAAAARFGVTPPPVTLPAPAAVLASLPAGPAAARAVNFAAGQVLAQHRGLWQLLEARAAARGKG